MSSLISISFNVPFNEAIKVTAQRGVVLPDVFYGQLQGVHQSLAFSIAGVASTDQLQAVLDSLTNHLKVGGTFAQWQAQVDVNELGLPKHRLDNIFRTNIQQAYNYGHWQQQIENRAARPYLLYDAINDSRTRPSHKANDGVIRPIDDPIWRRIWFSRNIYRCRCRLVSLTEAQAKARSYKGNGLNKAAVEDPKRDTAWDNVDVMNADVLSFGVQRAVEKRMTEGKVNQVLLSALDNKLKTLPNMKIVNLEPLIPVQKAISELAIKKPAWFPEGFNGIHAVDNSDFFAAYYQGAIYFSNADRLAATFNPALELASAFENIQAAKPLSFNQEYAIETLWHEMMHARTGVTSNRLILGEEPLNEGIVQLTARHSYPSLLEELGGNANHQEEILKRGYYYSLVTPNLIELISQANVTGEAIEALLLQYGNDYLEPLKALLMRGLKTKRVGTLLAAASRLQLDDFRKKIIVQQKNAPL